MILTSFATFKFHDGVCAARAQYCRRRPRLERPAPAAPDPACLTSASLSTWVHCADAGSLSADQLLDQY